MLVLLLGDSQDTTIADVLITGMLECWAVYPSIPIEIHKSSSQVFKAVASARHSAIILDGKGRPDVAFLIGNLTEKCKRIAKKCKRTGVLVYEIHM